MQPAVGYGVGIGSVGRGFGGEPRDYPEHEAVLVWAPSLRTGADGVARVPLAAPNGGARFVLRALVQTTNGGIGEAKRTVDVTELGGVAPEPDVPDSNDQNGP